jgi:hypothetical protein
VRKANRREQHVSKATRLALTEWWLRYQFFGYGRRKGDPALSASALERIMGRTVSHFGVIFIVAKQSNIRTHLFMHMLVFSRFRTPPNGADKLFRAKYRGERWWPCGSGGRCLVQPDLLGQEPIFAEGNR